MREWLDGNVRLTDKCQKHKFKMSVLSDVSRPFCYSEDILCIILNLKTGSKRREKISSRPHLYKEIPVSISLYRDCLGYEQLSLFAAPSIVSWGAVQLSTEV